MSILATSYQLPAESSYQLPVASMKKQPATSCQLPARKGENWKLEAGDWKPDNGFTLLELLVVIAIIGVLIALGTVSYSAIQRKSRDAKRESDLKSIQGALEQYYAANDGSYPGATCADYPGTALAEFMPQGVPIDPKSGNNYPCTTYTTSGYEICADLEEDETFDGTNCDVSVVNLQ